MAGEALERGEQDVPREGEVAPVPRLEQGQIVEHAGGGGVVLQHVELGLEVGHQPKEVATGERHPLDRSKHREVPRRRLERGLVALLGRRQVVEVGFDQSAALAVQRRGLPRVSSRPNLLVEVHDRGPNVAAVEVHPVQQPHRRSEVGHHLERVRELAHCLGLLIAQQMPAGGSRRERGAELRLGSGRRREG